MNDCKVKEYDYCLRCGRKLKNPNARILGFGNVCYNKKQSNGKIRLFQPLKYKHIYKLPNVYYNNTDTNKISER